MWLIAWCSRIWLKSFHCQIKVIILKQFTKTKYIYQKNQSAKMQPTHLNPSRTQKCSNQSCASFLSHPSRRLESNIPLWTRFWARASSINPEKPFAKKSRPNLVESALSSLMNKVLDITRRLSTWFGGTNMEAEKNLAFTFGSKTTLILKLRCTKPKASLLLSRA